MAVSSSLSFTRSLRRRGVMLMGRNRWIHFLQVMLRVIILMHLFALKAC